MKSATSPEAAGGEPALSDSRREGSNHLGNVLVVFSDRKLPLNSGGTVTGYQADVHAHSDYYPFGMVMEARTGSAEGYRFGFQGQETDDEVYGAENAVSYKHRVHDPRIGRFLSIDPLAPEYPWNSPYAFSENRVIDGVELEGLEVSPYMMMKAHANNKAREEYVNKYGTQEAKLQLQRDKNIALAVVAAGIYIPAAIEAAPAIMGWASSNPVAAEEVLRTGAEIATNSDMGPSLNDAGNYALKEIVVQSKASSWLGRTWRKIRSKFSSLFSRHGRRGDYQSPSGEDLLQMASRQMVDEKPLDLIGGAEIYGSKDMNGSEFVYDLAYIHQVDEDVSTKLTTILADITRQAKSNGATSVRINGYAVINPNLVEGFEKVKNKGGTLFGWTVQGGEQGGNVTLTKQVDP